MEIVVKVTTVSKTGVEGPPVTLKGQHPGGKLPANHALHQTLDPARLALPLQAACVKCR